MKAVSVLVESSRQGWLSGAEVGLDLGAAGVEEGAEDPAGAGGLAVDDGWMPPRPSVQAPRRSFIRTVSAWSSRVWAVRMASAWPCGEEGVEDIVAEGAGGLFDGLVPAARAWVTRSGTQAWWR